MTLNVAVVFDNIVAIGDAAVLNDVCANLLVGLVSLTCCLDGSWLL